MDPLLFNKTYHVLRWRMNRIIRKYHRSTITNNKHLAACITSELESMVVSYYVLHGMELPKQRPYVTCEFTTFEDLTKEFTK